MARQFTEQIGFKLSWDDRRLLDKAAEAEGAPSAQQWLRVLAVREAMRVVGAEANGVHRSQRPADRLAEQLSALGKADEACSAMQQQVPSLQLDGAAARNAIRNLIVAARLAPSGEPTASRVQARKMGQVPEGWITINEALAFLRERNGYAPTDRWLHKAKGRGLLVDPATWRVCQVNRDGKGWHAICVPKRWIEVAAPHLKDHLLHFY